MYEIIQKRALNPKVYFLRISAPLVAKKAEAGQFVILRVDEAGERIPLTIADFDRERGTVDVIFQIAGATTLRLSKLHAGEHIATFTGPLGRAAELDEAKKICVVGGGVGCAIALPVAKAFRANGAEVTLIAGFQSRAQVILEEELFKASDLFLPATDDGSFGKAGNAAFVLGGLLEAGNSFDKIFAVGPLAMMRAVVKTSAPYRIPVTVSMNPIMIDGTGMCGGCRLTLCRGQERIVKFACVDGPDFNGYEVDFDEAIRRGKMYREFERRAYEKACNLFQE